IQFDRAKLSRYGLNVEDLSPYIESAIGGSAIGTVYEDERRFDIAVRYGPQWRGDTQQLGRIQVRTSEGAEIPLDQLAEVKVENGASIVARTENQRQVSVRTNIVNRDDGSFVAEAQQRFAERIHLPPGYRVSWGGQFENLERAER